ncbi:MAG: cupin domain-containing protein [Acidobacteriota bacterium]
MQPSIYSRSDLEPRRLLPGTEVRLVHSETMTLASWVFEPDIDLPEHSHPHEQITTVLEGVFVLCIDGKPSRMEAGDIAVIPSGAVHSARSITRCRVIDAFHPVREDLR